MSRTTNRRKNFNAAKGTTRHKGDVLEQIVAALHESPNVKVETNVQIATKNNPERTREIDVLLTTKVDVYTVEIAIECKNYSNKVGVNKIDEFIGKLNDIGIPTQYGVFVSVNGFTSGAIDRANQVGIDVFKLDGIADALQNSIQKAFQSLIYLLLSFRKITVKYENKPINEKAPILFRNESDQFCGAIFDLIWSDWVKGKIPQEIGEHIIDIDIPKDWVSLIDGTKSSEIELKVTVEITGKAITFLGDVKFFNLINVNTNEIVKWYINANFDVPDGLYEIHNLLSEDEVSRFVDQQSERIKVVNRMRLPRILVTSLYWPPSGQTARKLKVLFEESQKRDIEFDFTNLTLTEIEGDDLHSIWDPIMSDYPPRDLLKRS